MSTRVQRTMTATLAHTFYVGEVATSATGTVSVAVTDANGSSVASGNATAAGLGYQFTLPAQAQLALLTVTWSATVSGVAVVETDQVEIVGGFFWTLTEGRDSDPIFADTAKYPAADMVGFRQEVEEECERICGRAFVPRYRRVVLDGTGTWDIVVPDGADEVVAGIVLRGVRTVRAAKVAPRVGQTFVALSAGELAALAMTADGMLRRTDGRVWTEGIANVVLEYEYGSDAPPADLKRATLLRLRSRANIHRSGVPDRAISFTMAEGGTYRLSTPGASRTGVPEVDGAYDRYSRGAGGGDGAAPTSRTLNYDPQHGSLFHGGLR